MYVLLLLLTSPDRGGVTAKSVLWTFFLSGVTFVRKSNIHLSVVLNPKLSFSISFLEWIVLNAGLKSTNSTLIYLFSFSRCVKTEWRAVDMASSVYSDCMRFLAGRDVFFHVMEPHSRSTSAGLRYRCDGDRLEAGRNRLPRKWVTNK